MPKLPLENVCARTGSGPTQLPPSRWHLHHAGWRHVRGEGGQERFSGGFSPAFRRNKAHEVLWVIAERDDPCDRCGGGIALAAATATMSLVPSLPLLLVDRMKASTRFAYLHLGLMHFGSLSTPPSLNSFPQPPPPLLSPAPPSSP